MNVEDRRLVDLRIGQGGFSLIEIALAIILVGLLFFYLVPTFKYVVVKHRYDATATVMKQAKSSLKHFVRLNGYVPCPDSSALADGREDRGVNGQCVSDQGRLPWRDLGMKNGVDGWGNYLYYRVSSKATDALAIRNPCDADGSGVYGASGQVVLGSSLDEVKPWLCTSTGRMFCLSDPERFGLDDGNVCPNGEIKKLVDGTPSVGEERFGKIMRSVGLWMGETGEAPYFHWETLMPQGSYDDPVVGQSGNLMAVMDVKWLKDRYNPNNRDIDPSDEAKYRLGTNVVAIVVARGGSNSVNAWRDIQAADNSIERTADSVCDIDVPATGVSIERRLQLRIDYENCDGDGYFVHDAAHRYSDDMVFWVDLSMVRTAITGGDNEFVR